MSQQLEETHFKAVDNKWYISILPYEESEYEDFHGPFDTQGDAALYAEKNLPSTSGADIYSGGTDPVPLNIQRII